VTGNGFVQSGGRTRSYKEHGANRLPVLTPQNYTISAQIGSETSSRAQTGRSALNWYSNTRTEPRKRGSLTCFRRAAYWLLFRMWRVTLRPKATADWSPSPSGLWFRTVRARCTSRTHASGRFYRHGLGWQCRRDPVDGGRITYGYEHFHSLCRDD
jgi:hypothetical protein